MRRSNIYLVLCVSFVIGIVLGLWVGVSFFGCYVVFLVGLVGLVLGWRDKKLRIISLGLFFLCLGILRFELGVVLRGGERNIEGYYGQEISLVGQVVAEPDVRDKNIQLKIGRLKLEESDSIRGKILVLVDKYTRINYGDWLKMTCQIEEPGVVDGFNYAGYLSTKGVGAVCYKPGDFNLGMEGYTLDWWQRTYKNILDIKGQAKQVVDQSLQYPDSEILSAMTLGLRGRIPQGVSDKFSRTGASHILAISGLHITIIAGLLMNLFLAIGLMRKKAFWVAAFSLVMFLMLIGFRASSIRAGVMGLLVMLAFREGRQTTSINSLLTAAAVLLLINPGLLFWDVGFQLSFMAVLGIIYLGPYFYRWFDKFRIPESFQLRSSLMMTLSAQVMVLPLIIYHFGGLSLVSPLTNVLILPLVPFLIIGGLMIILVGFVWLGLAQFVGWFVGLGVGYVLLVVGVLAKIPFGFLDYKIDWWIVIFIYLLIGGLIIYLSRKRSA